MICLQMLSSNPGRLLQFLSFISFLTISGITVLCKYSTIISMDNVFRFAHAYVLRAENTARFSSRNGGKLCFCLMRLANLLVDLKLRYHLFMVSAFFVMLTPILTATFLAVSQHFPQVHPFICSSARFNAKVSIRHFCHIACFA